MSSISSVAHSGVVRDFPVGLKPFFTYSELAISLLAKTHRVISANPLARVRLIASDSDALPNPLPADSGSTYSEKRCPRAESSLSLPILKTAIGLPSSISSSVSLSPGTSILVRHKSAALSAVKEARALSEITCAYEIVQQRKKISAMTGRSSKVALRNSTDVSL